MTTTKPIDIETLIAGHDVSDGRKESLTLALAAGADEKTLIQMRDTLRLSRAAHIILPPGRFEAMSRGKGWCRKGQGDKAIWADRVEGGYRVEVRGRWIVGSNDGFSRKDTTTWDVEFLKVGEKTWTIAS